MTDIPLNTLIEWTEEDRERGECPVPAGSDVTVWYSSGFTQRREVTEGLRWSKIPRVPPCEITAYLVHALPREKVKVWAVVGRDGDAWAFSSSKKEAERWCESYGRVIELQEVEQ